ncbi:MAG: Na+/H+ antiporter NhaC family protein [Bacteroidales bacterium]|nr:Na+/H+ antiporter NhaC family protein [Bacteroidales bacterium]
MADISSEVTAKQGIKALSPVLLFLGMYLIVSLVIGDFYKMPIAVAMLTASVWAIVICSGERIAARIEIYSREAGEPGILYMIWIFIMAGAFASLAKGIGSVDATVNAVLNFCPPQYIVPGMFVAACLISMAIGTSVGTVVALTPLALELSAESGLDLPYLVAAVLSGAFFGDNLSFISDTTISATRTQGCDMREKFQANLWIALPAALVTLAIYVNSAAEYPVTAAFTLQRVEWVLVLPYILIIGMALVGINVGVVLFFGITATLIIALLRGIDIMDTMTMMGDGIDSMGNLIIITLMAAGMLGIVKKCGGIAYILRLFTGKIRGSRGAQAAIAFLVGIVNICTANNTVAIITVGAISKDISKRFGVRARKSASLLDTGSCIVQCLIPYGAQTLLATALAGISPAAPWRYLYYPWILAVMLAISIIIKRKS